MERRHLAGPGWQPEIGKTAGAGGAPALHRNRVSGAADALAGRPGALGQDRQECLSTARGSPRLAVHHFPDKSIPVADLHILWYRYCVRCRMAEDPQPRKIPLIFFRTEAGSEPVREWLKELAQAERQAIGKDLLRAQWRWPAGMPLCRALGNRLWEVRTDLPTRRTARVLLCLYRGHLVALHGFIKKTRAMPDEDLALARKRQKELDR